VIAQSVLATASIDDRMTMCDKSYCAGGVNEVVGFCKMKWARLILCASILKIATTYLVGKIRWCVASKVHGLKGI
jgi:hypothetical protein